MLTIGSPGYSLDRPAPDVAEEVRAVLTRLIEEDSTRDPVDALIDAQVMFALLKGIYDVLRDPSTSYSMLNRLHEDLETRGIFDAVLDAAHLMKYNQQRVDAIPKDGSDAG